MKGALLVVALACLLILTLALAAKMADPPATFDMTDRDMVRGFAPGGSFLPDNSAYETCERGIKVRYYPDGLALAFPARTCWR